MLASIPLLVVYWSALGSVAEWLKAHDSKSCMGTTPSRVQIPPLPQEFETLVSKRNLKILEYIARSDSEYDTKGVPKL
jgi:hypothetical protein